MYHHLVNRKQTVSSLSLHLSCCWPYAVFWLGFLPRDHFHNFQNSRASRSWNISISFFLISIFEPVSLHAQFLSFYFLHIILFSIRRIVSIEFHICCVHFITCFCMSCSGFNFHSVETDMIYNFIKFKCFILLLCLDFVMYKGVCSLFPISLILMLPSNNKITVINNMIV